MMCQPTLGDAVPSFAIVDLLRSLSTFARACNRAAVSRPLAVLIRWMLSYDPMRLRFRPL